MAQNIFDVSPIQVAESTHMPDDLQYQSNYTVEITQPDLPSFDISDSYQDPMPDPPQDRCQFVSELPEISNNYSDDLVFEIIEGGTQRSNPLLVDSNDYSYTMKSHKHNRSDRITWRCSLRRKNLTCTATVLTPGCVYSWN